MAASASLHFQPGGLQNYEAGSMSWEKGVSALPLSTEMLARAGQTPETWSLWEQRAKNKQEAFHDLPTNMNHVSPKTLHMPPVMIPGHS